MKEGCGEESGTEHTGPRKYPRVEALPRAVTIMGTDM